MRRLAFVLVILLAATSGCDVLGPDVRYVSRRPLAPVPAAYAAWYADVEDCLGQAGDFEAVRWSVADVILRRGSPMYALGSLPHDVTIRADVLMAERVVRHEAVHHVLQAGDELHGTPEMARCEAEGA